MVEVLIQSCLPAQLCPTPLPAEPSSMGLCRVHPSSVVHFSFSAGIMKPHGISWIQDAFHTYSKDPQALKA